MEKKIALKNCCIYDCPNYSTAIYKENRQHTKIHKIPTERYRASQWQNFILNANAPQTNYKKHMLVCGLHFKPSDYLRDGKLCRTAVPCMKYAGDQHSEQQNSQVKKEQSAGEIILSANGSAVRNIKSINLSSASFSDLLETNMQCEETENFEISLSDLLKSSANQSFCSSKILTCPSTPSNTSRCVRKRYCGELSPSDFSTPERAKKNLDKFKKTLAECKRKLDLEQKRSRRLQKKVETLKNLVRHLKGDKNLIDDPKGKIR